MFAETVTIPAAFAAGLLSFFAPCIVPLIPAYFTFITGYSLKELTDSPPGRVRRRVILSTAAFVAGFSVVFILLGASASYLGSFTQAYSRTIRVIGGILIIILGIHLAGWMRIPWLDVEKRVRIQRKPLDFLGTFLVGMAFGAGWSPCIGPLLGSILIIAGNQETVWQGIWLLGIYSAGLAIPFIVMSVFINWILVWLKRITRALRYVNMAAGLLLILVGLTLVTDRLAFF